MSIGDRQAAARAVLLHSYGLDNQTLYNRFPRIKFKKNGTKKIRWIHAPHKTLKAIQKDILHRVLYRLPVHPAAHGYVCNANIVTNALRHCGKQYSIVIDLENFFPSIKREQIRTQLEYHRVAMQKRTGDGMSFCWDNVSNHLVKMGKATSGTFYDSLDLLVEACVSEGSLPQGAPTSGALSNVVFYPLDVLFDRTAAQADIIYTRYADDLTFSGDELEPLKQFVFGYVFNKIEANNFKVNQSKVHVLRGNQRIITGLNVSDQGVRPARKYRRKLRARLARVRNLVTGATNPSEVRTALKAINFVSTEFSHLWYLGYADQFSNCFRIWVDKYLYPIQDHIAKVCGSIDALANTLYDYSMLSGEKGPELSPEERRARMSEQSSLRILDANFSKLRKSEAYLTSPPTTWPELLTLLNTKGVSYKVKRHVIHHYLDARTDDLSNAACSPMLRMFRLAPPADRMRILVDKIKTITRPNQWEHFLWISKVCNRFAALDRLTLCKVIASSPAIHMVFQRDEHKLAFSKMITKLMHGIESISLSGFLTHPSALIRDAAVDLITLRDQAALTK